MMCYCIVLGLMFLELIIIDIFLYEVGGRQGPHYVILQTLCWCCYRDMFGNTHLD